MPLMRTVPILAVLLLCGCNSVFQEVVDQGGTRFFNKAKVQSQSSDGNVTSYTFDPHSGPVCLQGAPYTVSVRDTNSDGLFIFLQGGGACWSQFCLATTEAPAGIPQAEILDPSKKSNPLAGWSLVYLPYCDGSLFAGDADWTSPQYGALHQHGLQNLSAALDLAVQRFPNPKRIVLAGSSGGGYGTILATTLVRIRYPDRPILVFDDSGVGLGKPGDAMFIDQILTEFNASSLIPKSCKNCTANGHITPLVSWELAHDPQLQISDFSSFQDYVISQVYLQIDANLFQTTLLSETGAIHESFPTRYKRFLISGSIHTTLLGSDPTGLVGSNFSAVILPQGFLNEFGNVKLGGIDTTIVGGVSVATWFQAMIDGSSGWDDRLDQQ
jgi:hypothetical protein